ncbi:hypothetical protein B9Z19DRAFT_151701 [Tuber borchii]|uniref:Transmembrane protein n=1 Tax=Tuber borchii TaxID=42251 RepID=A0A2T6ZQ84_TUBBO|nr:hypothetical protein B9Z19DRAFT_151701 [Tuber borchii]
MSDTGYNGGGCGVGSAEFGRLHFANCLGVFLSFFLGSQVSVFLFYLHLLRSNPVARLVRGKRAMGFSHHHFYGKGLRCYGFCLLLGLAGGGGCQYILFFPAISSFFSSSLLLHRVSICFLCSFSFIGVSLGSRILWCNISSKSNSLKYVF